MMASGTVDRFVGERRRILFVAAGCYLDDSNGAAIASRAMLEWLAAQEWPAEALTGTVLDTREDVDPAAWLDRRNLAFEVGGGDSWTADARGLRPEAPTHHRSTVRGVSVSLHPGAHGPGEQERAEFLRLLEHTLERFRPELVVNYGGDDLARIIRTRAHASGAAVVFPLHNFNYHTASPFTTADSVIVPSRFAADYYLKTLGLHCTVLPNLVDLARVRAQTQTSRYVTFVNPSYEKGVFAFARIADELGRRRPDIPLLVVEGRGSERTLADCGIDLRVHGNVSLMAHTHDPRKFWGVTRICLMPSLWWENQPLTAIEAMVNGIPVIGSDRGGLPEALGNAGVVLPLPDRITPATRILPMADEVAPWVEAVIRLWDESEHQTEYQRRAVVESQRWTPEVLGPQYLRFLSELRQGGKTVVVGVPKVGNVAAVVAYAEELSRDCDQALERLEEAGVRVRRRGGCLDLDAARSGLLSDALHDGAESVLLLDPDTGFDPDDALRLLARPEPVIAGICQKVSDHAHGVVFADGVLDAYSGPGLYPMERAGAEFLRLRAEALRRMIDTLDLPLCDTDRGRGTWPFFQPAVIPGAEGGLHYMGSVAAFFHRLGQAGITPMADTSVRLKTAGRTSLWAVAATAWDQVPGMFDFAAVYDAAVDAAPDGAVFVEVGCLAGRSTCYLGAKIRESGKAITLYAVDTGRGSATDSTGQLIAPAVGGSLAGILHRNLIGCGVDDHVIPIVTTSTRAARLFPPGSIDLCFIDADHSYESVTEDLRTWWPRVKPGGTLAGHDYRQSAPWLVGVTAAVHDFFGVRDASHPSCPSCWSVTKL